MSARAQRALDRTAAWIERFGGRPAGTDACLQTARAIQTELKRLCGEARLEPFSTRAGAFNGFYQVDAFLYLIGLGLLWINQPFWAGLVLTGMVSAAGLQFGWYIELYDRLYPLKACRNVTAVLEPQGEARQQVIFSAHHDSAYVLNFLRRNQKLYGLKIIIPDAFRFLGLMTAWVWLGWQALSGSVPPFVLPARILLLVGIYFVFTKFFLFGPEASPGAGDNLIASAILLELAEKFADQQVIGQSTLEHTRLIFASFDAEEAGLRGSRAWVKAHRAELQSLPAYALNFDSIYRAEDVQFLLSDLNSHVKLDHGLAEQCRRIAGEVGIGAGLAVMRFGGGGTDAAELTRAGVHATTMLGMSTRVVRDGLVYHTLGDTVGAIEPEAVEACLGVAERLARELDNRIGQWMESKSFLSDMMAPPLN